MRYASLVHRPHGIHGFPCPPSNNDGWMCAPLDAWLTRGAGTDSRSALQPQEGTEAGDRELVAIKLRRLAVEEGGRRRAARRAALEWAQTAPSPDQVRASSSPAHAPLHQA